MDNKHSQTQVICQCHQCTWLRASQFERLIIDGKFQPAGKKECEGIAVWSESHCPGCTAIKVPRKSFAELVKCTCHYTDERVEDPKCPRHTPADSGKCECGKPDRSGWVHQMGLPCMELADSEKAVEAKIVELNSFFVACDPRKGFAQKHFDELIRELRDLARKA